MVAALHTCIFFVQVFAAIQETPPKNAKNAPFWGQTPERGTIPHPPRKNAQKCAKKCAVPPPSEPHPPPAATFTMRRATFGRGFPTKPRGSQERSKSEARENTRRRLYRSPSEVRETHKKPPPPQRNTPNGILTKKSKKICKKFAQLKNVCHLCNVKKIRV